MLTPPCCGSLAIARRWPSGEKARRLNSLVSGHAKGRACPVFASQKTIWPSQLANAHRRPPGATAAKEAFVKGRLLRGLSASVGVCHRLNVLLVKTVTKPTPSVEKQIAFP